MENLTETFTLEFTDLEESRADKERGGSDFSYVDMRPQAFHERVQFRGVGSHSLYRDDVNVPVKFASTYDHWMVVIRQQPASLNGVTIDQSTLVLFPDRVELNGYFLPGVEHGIYTKRSVIESILGPHLPGHVVGVNVDPKEAAALARNIQSELDGDLIEGGVLARCLSHFDQGSERFITPARERLACTIRDFIDSRLDSNICLSEVCRRAGVSVRTAERAFKIRFQETMSAYIKRARLDQARNLLLAGQPVTDAALNVGWTHLGRFSVEFKKRFGESPSVLQKRHRPAA